MLTFSSPFLFVALSHCRFDPSPSLPPNPQIASLAAFLGVDARTARHALEQSGGYVSVDAAADWYFSNPDRNQPPKAAGAVAAAAAAAQQQQGAIDLCDDDDDDDDEDF